MTKSIRMRRCQKFRSIRQRSDCRRNALAPSPRIFVGSALADAFVETFGNNTPFNFLRSSPPRPLKRTLRKTRLFFFPPHCPEILFRRGRHVADLRPSAGEAWQVVDPSAFAGPSAQILALEPAHHAISERRA